VGKGVKRDEQFATMIDFACRLNKPVRIGVNWGSLDQELLARLMDANGRLAQPRDATVVMRDALVTSALESAQQAEALGLPHDRIVLSCKVSGVQDLIAVYRDLASRCDYPLHLGLTEAGMGSKGIVASTAALGVLLQEGVFSSVGNDLTVYARKRDPDGTLRGIMVHDQREAGGAVTILAQSGRIGQGADGPRVTLYDGVRQQMEKGASGAPPRLTVLSFSENSVDLARVARNEETRSRDSRERSISELLYPDPSEELRPRDVRRFRSEAHQRMASPLTALSFALVGLAVALTGQFRRHGGGIGVVLGVGIMVALLALGLTLGNAAARRDGLIWLIWLHAILPGVISAWWLGGAPGLPRKAPPREALP
jgi:hypothetical protein